MTLYGFLILNVELNQHLPLRNEHNLQDPILNYLLEFQYQVQILFSILENHHYQQQHLLHNSNRHLHGLFAVLS